MPNTMEPTDAQINIAKFNRSVIVSALVCFSGACNVRALALGPLSAPGAAMDTLLRLLQINVQC